MMTTMAAPGYGATTMVAPYAATAPITYAAAPQMLEYATAAPQVTYAAAPQVAEYSQPAVTYAAAPQMVQTVAAPQVTYAAAPVTTQVASYVPSYMPAMIPTPAAPVAPPDLTNGIPNLDQIGQQKAGYAAALDKQLKDAVDTVQKETQIEKDMLKFQAEKQVALFTMQVEEKLAEALANTDEQATFSILELNKAKVERGIQLNAQASGLVMDYQMKAVQTELAQKQYAFQMQYMTAENALAQDYQRQLAQANTGTTYSVPASAVA